MGLAEFLIALGDLRRRAGIAQLVLQRREIVKNWRPDIGIDHRSTGALVLAQLRQDIAGQRNENAGQGSAQYLAGKTLVDRVRVGMKEADGYGLDLLGADLDKPAPVIATYARAVLRSPSPAVWRRRMPDDAATTAHQLFAVLREFDAQGVKLIWVETPPAGSEWDGVRDRLQRASVAQ